MLDLINQFVYRPEVVYHPQGFTPANIGLTYEEVALQTADDLTLSAWYLPAPNAQYALLYCHGNAGDIGDWVHAMPPFLQLGISTLIWDYRGYGLSQGQPSEQGLCTDGLAAWDWLRARAEKDSLPAAILGKSLGSAVGIYVATHPDTLDDPKSSLAALILDSAFTSMREIVAIMAPAIPSVSIPPLYESWERVAAIACPTLVLHGGRDTLVPLQQGQRIYDTLKAPRRMKIIEPAGHNDISAFPEYHPAILNFLEDPPT